MQKSENITTLITRDDILSCNIIPTSDYDQ